MNYNNYYSPNHYKNVYLGIYVKTAKLENTSWRHQECCTFTNIKKSCDRCESLYPYFRSYKRRSLLQQKKRIGPTLTPNRRSILKKMLNEIKKLKKSNNRYI